MTGYTARSTQIPTIQINSIKKTELEMIHSKGIRRSLKLKVCNEVKTRLLKLLKRARAVQQRAGNLISQRLMAFQPSSTQLSTSLLPVSAGVRPHTQTKADTQTAFFKPLYTAS